MKKTAFFILAASATFACRHSDSKPELSGAVANVTSGVVYLQKFENKAFRVVDSAAVKDGTFRLPLSVPLPEVYGLTLDAAHGQYLVFLEQGNITVLLDSAHRYHNTTVAGSALHDLYRAYRQQGDSVHIDTFIAAHPASLVAAYALYRDFSWRLSAEEILANVARLDSSLWGTPYVKTLQELAATLQTVSVGKPAIDFTANDTAGNPVALASRLGKGYLLLEFWASWCPDCREDNPAVVKAYNKYKGKGFDILAVSLDRDRERWVKAIAKDNLTWTHVSDLKRWDSSPAALYGVRAIPANVLIDKSGTIVARNLYGEALEDALRKVYGGK
ncbi:MAG: AhpC/TSA family protein [Prevotellaceae bacterium]|jgi:peroxiredoxin|nr:AhpC/TSA family protein [Prevotellaceae bacterium]